MARIFSAIEIGDAVRDALAAVQNRLDYGFKPVDPAQMHVTLQFFEDINEPAVDQVVSALNQVSVSPFKATVTGLGAFPSTDFIKVVWAGVQADMLDTLYAQVTDHGVQADSHDFHPHVTLLRVNHLSRQQKNRLQDAITDLNDHVFGSFTVDHITLFESRLTSDGPEYVERYRKPL